MLFLQFEKYLLSFAGTPKNEIPGAALELCQLKIKQFSPDILKFSTKHEENSFTLNCFMVSHSFLFIFHAGSHRLGSNNFQNSSYKEKMACLVHVSKLSLCFLWLCYHKIRESEACHLEQRFSHHKVSQESLILVFYNGGFLIARHDKLQTL